MQIKQWRNRTYQRPVGIFYKICSQCRIKKSSEEFSKCDGNRDGLLYTCKKCMRCKLYKITSAEYEQIFARQNKCCAICGIRYFKPVIDHNHDTNLVRGILCYSCNTFIGNAKENIGILQRAIEYLKGK